MRKLTGRGLETLSGRPVSSKWLELRCEPRFTWLWTLQSWLCTILATEGWKESALDLIGLLFLANTKQSSLSYIGGEALVQIDLLMSCLLSCFSCVWLFVILWTVARQALLPMGFSRQKYWSGLPFPPPKDLPDPGIELATTALQEDSLLLSHQRSPKLLYIPAIYLLPPTRGSTA